MLSLTKKTEYALIAMCHLARAGDQQVFSARDIAERYGAPLPLLMNVLKTLHRGGLVRSLRGARGGYSIGRAAAGITLGDLIEAVEGPVALVECMSPPGPTGKPCDMAGTCPVRLPVQRVHERFRRFLGEITIAEIAFDEGFVELQFPVALAKVVAQ